MLRLRKLRKVRRPRTIYHKEIMMKDLMMKDLGIIYAPADSKLDPLFETLIRLKFRRRKWIGAFGWDVDRQRMHMYASREQRHKKMRIGWEYSCWYSCEVSLGNLRKVR